MVDLTIITPAAPHHVPHLDRARASVAAQSVPCEHLIMIDEEQRGPGYIRNRLIEEAQTPYVAFLDADDTLEPQFAEKALAAIRDG